MLIIYKIRKNHLLNEIKEFLFSSFLTGLFFAFTAVSAQASDHPIIVQTSQGILQGYSEQGVSRFLGIPYAAAPIGPLRFRPPQPPSGWRGVRNATVFGAACPQLPMSGASSVDSATGTPSTDEDCLSVNVFVPSQLDTLARRPVLVFFYGGDFKYGAAVPGVTHRGPNYDGSRLALQTGAVVVTFNYRLGILGFLSLPVLDAESVAHVSGNYGLRDQQALLQWLQTNIVQFGGDPHKVTLFGQSAGAVSIVEQMVAPTSQSLFGAVQIESPGQLPATTLSIAETRNANIPSLLGCDGASDLAACLRQVPISKLLNTAFTPGPVIDGSVLPLPPDQAIADGRFQHVPMIVGTNADEGRYFIAVQPDAARLGSGSVRTSLDASYGQVDAARIMQEYRSDAASPAELLAAIDTDGFFSCPALSLRRSATPYTTVLQYEFSQATPAYDYPVPQIPFVLNADAHTAELAYVFGQNAYGAPLARDTDRVLSDVMMGALTGLQRMPWSFIGRHSWEKAWQRKDTVLELRNPVVSDENFASRHHCQFWINSGIRPRMINVVP